MAEQLPHALGLLAAVLALAGAACAVLSARAVRRLPHRPQHQAPLPAGLAASILKPLHGAEPGLAANLAATLGQHHAPGFEVLFAVREPTDPAAAIAATAMATAPRTAARLLPNARLHGPNRKISQLTNLESAARHVVLVVADADMRVPPGWLTAVVAPLADPAVGIVTCLYRGQPADAGIWSRLAALGIDWQFLPNAALGESLGRADGCYGATIAIRAETLARIGGFAAFAGLLADDHAMGAAVRGLGLRVVLAPVLPAHVMAEPSLGALLRHELRWARTLRLLDFAGYCGMGITYPLVPGLLAAALAPAPWGLAALAAALAARLALAITVDRALGHPISVAGPLGRLAFLPLRDLLSFAIWVAGLARGTVVWQGRRYRMDPFGRMAEASLRTRSDP